MYFQPNPKSPPQRLYKVVTLTVCRAHQLIEAESETEALEAAQVMSQQGSIIDRHSVASVSNVRKGGC